MSEQDKKELWDTKIKLLDIGRENSAIVRERMFQLFLSRLDFIKNIAQLTAAIAGFAYLYKDKNEIFFLFSLVSSLSVIIIIISYVREKADLVAKEIRKSDEDYKEGLREYIEKINETLKTSDARIWKDHIRSVTNPATKKKDSIVLLEYDGEIVTFLFYLSIGFLLLGLFSWPYGSCVAVLSLFLLSFFLSFSNWTTFLFNYLNEFINRIASRFHL